MTILDEVKESWGWTGIDPKEVVAENDFGNLIMKDADDKFWRLCPEDVYCEVVAESIAEYNLLIKDKEFLEDWFMQAMVEEAEKKLGALKPGYKYHMVIPGILCGEYNESNFNVAPLYEIVRFSGDLGRQIQDLPDGAKIEIKWIE